jgi:glycosyltransferase involved in cell wall biosynthesis
MRNICFFNCVRFWGGGEKLHLEYATAFKKKNYNVYLVSGKNSPLSKKGHSEGLQIFNIYAGNLAFLNPIKQIKLVRFFRKENIDTVIFSGSPDLKLGGIAAKLAKVRNIVYLRGLAVPIKNSLLNRILLKDILTHIVANSEETKRTILGNMPDRIDKDKVKVIYHGIDVNPSNEKTNNKLELIAQQGHGIILGSAGRLTKQKGQQHLIEIAKILKDKQIDFTLFIAGTGEMYATLEDLIAKNDLQKEVILLGFVQDIESFMSSIDIFLLTSIWEGFGYVLVEAMVKSKPVVAFDITSNPEIVTRDKSGFLVDFPDVNKFAEKVQLLIDNEPVRQQFGEAGKKSVLERFRLDERIDEFESHLLGNM